MKFYYSSIISGPVISSFDSSSEVSETLKTFAISSFTSSYRINDPIYTTVPWFSMCFKV